MKISSLQDNLQDNQFYKSFFVGSLAGVLSRTITAPLELNKIQRQNYFIPNTSLTSVIQKEGFLSLWKGNLTNIIRIFPQMGINYSILTTSSNALQQYNLNSPLQMLIAGSCGGIVSTISLYPLENIRTRLSLQTNKQYYNGVIDVFRKTPIHHLYRGLNVSLMGYVPYNALNFSFNELYTNIFDMQRNNKINSLLSGGLSGLSSIIITYPTDLIRRRLQIQGFQNAPTYNGVIHCVKDIYKTERIYGFYRGLSPTILKIIPTSSLQFYFISLFDSLYTNL